MSSVTIRCGERLAIRRRACSPPEQVEAALTAAWARAQTAARQRVPPAYAPAHGLGVMEANMDEPYARRFKRRGMSWSRAGLQAMAKALQRRRSQPGLLRQ